MSLSDLRQKIQEQIKDAELNEELEFEDILQIKLELTKVLKLLDVEEQKIRERINHFEKENEKYENRVEFFPYIRDNEKRISELRGVLG